MNVIFFCNRVVTSDNLKIRCDTNKGKISKIDKFQTFLPLNGIIFIGNKTRKRFCRFQNNLCIGTLKP